MMSKDAESGILLLQYRNNIKKEVFRKSIHLCSAFVPTFLDLSFFTTLALLFCALFAYSFSEILRLKGVNIPLVAKITEVASRKRDENKFVLGPVTLVVGIILAALFLDSTGYHAGIYALAFGDGLASLFGKLFGRVHVAFTKGKTAAGSLACFVAVFVTSFFVCQNATYAFVLAFSAMIIEIIPMTDLDNIFIPVVIGALAMFLVNYAPF